MNFYLIGIDHRTASLDVREDIYRKRRYVQDFWAEHSSQKIAILTTCNRFEIYGIAKDTEEAERHIDIFNKEFPGFLENLYLKLGEYAVFHHALRLACGLESQLHGEEEILAQVDAWHNQKSFPEALFKLWRDAIWMARYIRLEAHLNERKYNIATLVLGDISRQINHDKRIEIVIIGTGKIAELFASNFTPEARFSFVANKNYSKAKWLANRAGGEAFSFRDLPELFLSADAVVSATASPHFIFRAGDLSDIIAKRARPIHLYDVAMPRDIDPAVGEIKNVILKNTEDLSGLFREYNERVSHNINLAAYLIEEAVARYRGAGHEESFKGRNTAQLIGDKTG